MLAVEAVKISYTYSDGTIALKNVNLSIDEGETVVLLGPNGSGKTTLLLILSCLLQPQSGILKIRGKKVNKKNLDEVRRHVGIVLQNPDDQVIAPIVYDDIAFGLRNLGYDEEFVARRVDEILKTMNLEELKYKNPDYLSGGQKKKVAIAGILAMDPEIIIMDEPTAGLDGIGFKMMCEVVEKLKNKTLIIATHDMDFAEVVGNRYVYIKDGRIVHESEEIDYQLSNKLGIRSFLRGKIVLTPHDSEIPEIDYDFIAAMGNKAKDRLSREKIDVDITSAVLDRSILRALEGNTVLLVCSREMMDVVRREVSKFPISFEILDEKCMEVEKWNF